MSEAISHEEGEDFRAPLLNQTVESLPGEGIETVVPQPVVPEAISLGGVAKALEIKPEDDPQFYSRGRQRGRTAGPHGRTYRGTGGTDVNVGNYSR